MIFSRYPPARRPSFAARHCHGRSNGGSRFEPAARQSHRTKTRAPTSAPAAKSPCPRTPSQRKAPLGRAERRIQLPHLKQADRRVGAIGHHGEAQIPARLPLALRPLMNRSKPSSVVGGGEINRVTSSVVKSARSDGASVSPQFAQREARPRAAPAARSSSQRRDGRGRGRYGQSWFAAWQ